MRFTRHASSSYRRMRWKNDLGWTTELAIAPADGSLDAGFDWRLSIAEIESDCDFSRLDGCDRSLMLLEGDGVALSFDGGDEVPLRERGRAARFAGEAATHCRLIGGPGRDFNAITRRGVYTHQVWLRPLAGPLVLFPDPSVTWFVYQLSGSVECRHGVQREDLVTHESAAIEFAAGENGQCVLAGGGELVLVKLERLGAGFPLSRE